MLKLSALLVAIGLAHGSDFAAEFDRLKAEIHTLSQQEAKDRLDQLRRLRQEEGPVPRQTKIDHFVVLLLENHAFDQMWGCMGLNGTDGIPPGGRQLPNDPKDPSKGYVNVSCGTAPYVCPSGPGYTCDGGKWAPGADTLKYPYGEQDDKYSVAHGAKGIAVQMYSKNQLPVKAAIGDNFRVFNKWWAGTPTASTPNHLFIQSATSCGITGNIMYSNKACGGKVDTFPQMTIYDSLYAHNLSFNMYMNATCGLPDGKGGKYPPCHGESPHTPDAGSPVPSPDVALDGVRRYPDHFKSQGEFYDAAAKGTLPHLSWILPHEQECDHPCYDNAKGERLLKDVYEAVRAGPAWNKTLFLMVYDDTGGYYDHVVPFSDVPSGDEAPCRCPNAKFDFRRLGLRGVAAVMSPWVSKGYAVQEPTGPTANSQFEHSSVPATLKNLFGLSSFLTKRDAWAGSLDELLLDAPRTDCPMHLPTAPKPAKPFSPPHPGDWPPTPPPAHPTPPPTPPPAGWGDAGVGRCETTVKQFGDSPPAGFKYDTQTGLTGSLTYSDKTSLVECESLCSGLTGCAYASWGHADDAGAGFCYVAKTCENLVSHSNYHTYNKKPGVTQDSAAGAQHCSLETGVCHGDVGVTAKQRKNIGWFASITGKPVPDIEAMTNAAASQWLRARWDEWMASRDEL